MVKPPLGSFDFTVAITAIYRFTTAWFERYCSILATFGAFYGKHLAHRPGVVAAIPKTVAVVPVLLGFPCLAARRAALRLVSIAFGREFFLFTDAENESSPTICTLDRFVLIGQWMILLSLEF
jgi:hypothetical protein